MNTIGKFLIGILTAFSVYRILTLFGVFDIKRGNRKTEEDYRVSAKRHKRRDIESKKLEFYSGLCELFGFLYTSSIEESHSYIIARRGYKSEKLGRELTPKEYRGKYIMRLLIGIICIPLSYIKSPFIAVTVCCVCNFVSYQQIAKLSINDEDAVLDNNFCNLFLMLYAELSKGSRGSLKSTLLSYSNSLKSFGDCEMTRVMGRFSEFFLANLNMYPDNIAVSHLTERYKSATVISFANLASQSLQGVNNKDTLLSFRMSIERKKYDSMKIKREKMARQGQIAVYVVYLILFQYVILSVVAKLPSKSLLPF